MYCKPQYSNSEGAPEEASSHAAASIPHFRSAIRMRCAEMSQIRRAVVVTPQVITPQVITPQVITPQVITPQVITPDSRITRFSVPSVGRTVASGSLRSPSSAHGSGMRRSRQTCTDSRKSPNDIKRRPRGEESVRTAILVLARIVNAGGGTRSPSPRRRCWCSSCIPWRSSRASHPCRRVQRVGATRRERGVCLPSADG